MFLQRALHSVAAQTYDDYIHVIINDGGDTARVDNLIASLSAAQRTRTKVYHRDKPSGGPDTIFTESIDREPSEYVAIHDDDDTWHPEFLEQTVSKLDAGAAGVVVRTDRVYESLEADKINMIKKEHYMPSLVAVSLYRQCIDNQLTPIAFVYRRDAYEKVGKYDASLPVVGDWEFGIRFLREYDVEYLDPGFALANYHQRKSRGDNSFAKHSHRYYVTKINNQYFRHDLGKNGLGIGYVMSKLKYDQDVRNGLMKRVIPKWLLKIVRK